MVETGFDTGSVVEEEEKTTPSTGVTPWVGAVGRATGPGVCQLGPGRGTPVSQNGCPEGPAPTSG